MARPLRVLHIAAGNLYGGVEALLRTFARHNGSELPLSSEFALCFEGRLSEELRGLGAPLHRLGAVQLRDLRSVASANAALWRVLASGRHDAVVTHGAWAHVAFGPCAKLAGVRLVTWDHGAPLRVGWLDRIADRIRPDLLIANSWHTLERAEGRGRDVPTRVVYAPVDPPAIDAAARAAVRTELDSPSDAFVILIAARLERWKGHALLVAALAELARGGARGFELWLCGGAQRAEEATYSSELQRSVEGAGLGAQVRWLGQRRDVPRLMQAADVLCQPNTGPEPFGIVFVEAMYAGLPVVTTNLGGGREIVDATSGVLVEPEPAAVAGALRDLMNDADRRRRLAASAPARARQLCAPAARIAELAAAIDACGRAQRRASAVATHEAPRP